MVQKRDKSTALTSLRRGRGGRSSFSGAVVTVFGASGLLGKILVNKLGKMGCQVIIPYRTDPYYVDSLRLCGDLGQILFLNYHLRDEESIKKAMKYSNVVVNLVGSDFETNHFTYNEVHIDGARTIARLAKESPAVEKFIHFSSMNASESPQKIFFTGGGSRFLKSKHFGELAVREEYPEAVIFRPAEMYGHEDRYFCYYGSALRRNFNSFPLWKKGSATIKQPVFVSDVAEGVVNAIMNPGTDGQTYEALGPNRYYLADLVNFYNQNLRLYHFKLTNMTIRHWIKMRLWKLALRKPIISSMDKLERSHVSDISTGCPTLEDLGVKNLGTVEVHAPYFLNFFRLHNYYDDYAGLFPPAIPPPLAPAGY